MAHFILKAKHKLAELPVGTRIDECDFVTTLNSGEFVQMTYVDDDNTKTPYIVKPGIWNITRENNAIKLEVTEFSKEDILESFVKTKNVTDKIDCFFNKLHIYKKYGIETPKRGVLLYGPAGSGKSTIIKLVSKKYAKDNNTAIVIWPTDKIDPNEVKEFIKSFEYKDVTKLILIAEDLGGVEVDEVKVKSYSSLLALLDNQEKAFRIPTLVVATTNHPEAFLGNITNRPGRFSDKIEVGYPSSEDRQELFKFYLKERVTESLVNKMGDKKYGKFTPAHIQEIALRSDLFDLTVEQSIDSIAEEISEYEKMFQGKNKKSFGIQHDYYDD
jgi:SpoVK/Ycf46/Vps4 family AAA+-type ATPase